MQALNRAIDRFCYKHPRFGIPNLMLFIVIGNVIVYLFSMMDRTGYFLTYLYFSPALVLQGEVWRLITFIFVPDASNLLYLFLFLYFYYFIGSALERQWGSGKFTIYYFSGVLLTILYGFVVHFCGGSMALLGAGYINLSMFFAFATFYPNNIVLLLFVIPIKIKWLAYIDAAYFLLNIFMNPFPYSLLPVIALLNYLIFCGPMLWDSLRFLRQRFSRPHIHQKRQARQTIHEVKNKPYTHKCAVCGRTDTEYPDLEFRYCSRCAGYHCFCIDHINSHVHFTE